MMLRKLLALSLALTPAIGHAEWFKVETRRFSMLGDFKSAAEAKTRGEKLEKFVFVLRALSAQPNVDSPQKVSVYFVPNKEDMLGTFPGFYENYYGIGAYYQPGVRQSVVVTPIHSYADPQTFNTNRAVVSAPNTFADDAFWHELSHAFMYQSVTYAYPTWYSEGYAEYYGTIDISDDNKISIGAPQHGRIETFRNNWYPSRKFLTNRNYDEAGDNLLSVYAEGWLLIHYCANNKERSAQMKKYLADINANVPYSEAAKAFGDLDQLDRELQRYAGKSIPTLSLAFKPIDTGQVDVRKATLAEVALYKYDIKLNEGVYQKEFPGFVSSIRHLAAAYPADPFALRILTEAETKAGNIAAGEAADARWLAVAPADPLALMYRGRLAEKRLANAHTPAADPGWTKARADLLAANKVAPTNPFIKQAYYESFTDANEVPPPSAQNALVQALKAVPHDSDLRFAVAADYERRGMIPEAIMTIKPSAVMIKPNSEMKPGELARKDRRDKQHKRETVLQGEDVNRETSRELYDRLVAKQGGAEAKSAAADDAAAKKPL